MSGTCTVSTFGLGARCDDWTMGNCGNDGTEGLYCDIDQQTHAGLCAKRRTAGQECTQRFECAKGLDCVTNGSGRTCEALKAAGEACTANDQCDGKSFCKNGTCTTRSAGGVACTEHVECASWYCDNGVCSTPACAREP